MTITEAVNKLATISGFANELLTIAENTQAVYNAGVRDGQAQGGDDRSFWDEFQDYGNRTDYAYAFRSWKGSIFNPYYSMAPTGGGADNMFAFFNIDDLAEFLTNKGITLDFSGVTRLINTFWGCKTTRLPVIDLLSCNELNATFNAASNLTDLTLANINDTCTFNKAFVGCNRLVNLSISGTIGTSKTSSLTGFDVSVCPLTHDSLMSVINALATKTSGEWVATLGETNLANLTADEKKIATDKGWTLV